MIRVDRHTIIEVLGGLMNNPDLLNDTDKYCLTPDDFEAGLDRYIYSAIYNLYADGANQIHSVDIVNFLNDNPSAKDLIEKQNGLIFLQDCETQSEVKNFGYYYNNLKKINLVCEIQKTGRNIDDIYCEDILNPNYLKINEKFKTLSVNDIVNKLKGEVAVFENKYSYNNLVEESRAADNMETLIKEWRQTPEIGAALQGEIFNTITRGARLGKLYLRSSPSSGGKSRSMVAEACELAYPIRYEPKEGKWVATGSCEKVLYVMTEQDTEEIKTMILAYLTGYNEEIFLYGTYGEEEMPRILAAVDIMNKYKDNFLFARIPDPCASIVKNLFRKYNLQYGVSLFFYDYIFSSPAMLSEYRDLGLQEHVALRLFTTALKNLAVELNSFIMTSTQTNSEDDPKGGFRDYRNIAGSKSIRDLVDFGCIMARITETELQQVSKLLNSFDTKPNVVIDVYKNRRGRWTNVRIWSNFDYGNLRKRDLFITDASMRPLSEFKIHEHINEEQDDYSELLSLYNTGELKPELENKYYTPDELINNSVEDFGEIFNNIEDARKRVKDKDWDDFL